MLFPCWEDDINEDLEGVTDERNSRAILGAGVYFIHPSLPLFKGFRTMYEVHAMSAI